jgi:hypothetical protein
VCSDTARATFPSRSIFFHVATYDFASMPPGLRLLTFPFRQRLKPSSDTHSKASQHIDLVLHGGFNIRGLLLQSIHATQELASLLCPAIDQ